MKILKTMHREARYMNWHLYGLLQGLQTSTTTTDAIIFDLMGVAEDNFRRTTEAELRHYAEELRALMRVRYEGEHQFPPSLAEALGDYFSLLDVMCGEVAAIVAEREAVA